MSDKIRGALFNALGDIEGLTVLDSFAGSGAIALEAVSRGAGHVIALDIDKGAINTIVKNATQLGIGEELKITRVGVASWLQTSAPGLNFDIVVCDPPYDDPHLSAISSLAGRVKPGGLLVLSLPPKLAPSLSSTFTLLSAKVYGNARLHFFRRES